MSKDQLKVTVVDVQFSFGSLGLFKGSWHHQTAWDQGSQKALHYTVLWMKVALALEELNSVSM